MTEHEQELNALHARDRTRRALRALVHDAIVTWGYPVTMEANHAGDTGPVLVRVLIQTDQDVFKFVVRADPRLNWIAREGRTA